jgi:predicted phosphodiesterase
VFVIPLVVFMTLICSRCGGQHFRKKGIEYGKQQYMCVSKLKDGSQCGCRKYPVVLEEELVSEFEDIQTENRSLAKRIQKIQDQQRIERKAFRENTRGENALIEFISELRIVVQENPIVVPSYIDWQLSADVKESKSKSVGVVHLSDIHFNELVDIVGNKYDFKVASQRLRLLAEKVIVAFAGQKISKVHLVLTGDLLNSDRRLDEIMAMAANRATATFIAVKILAQFIMHLSIHFEVSVVSVTGNESRIKEDYTHLDAMATDNFDFIIYELLKMKLDRYKNRIKFISGNTFEYILSINGTNILVVHGHRLGKMDHNDTSKAISKWAKRGIIIHFIMCGHLHETKITDTLLRSGSLVGNNAYADAGLNLNSWASQNFYIIDEFGRLDATKVDLQNVNDTSVGYNVDEDLDAYNAKSIDKLKDPNIILQIVT